MDRRNFNKLKPTISSHKHHYDKQGEMCAFSQLAENSIFVTQSGKTSIIAYLKVLRNVV